MNCPTCEKIEAIKENKSPYFVKELETGYVVLADHQFYKGYTVFLSKEHATELHELDSVFKRRFLEEMSLVAKAVFHAFNPVKLNYELLGNTNPHLHWHIIPRYADDLDPLKPIWVIDEKVRKAESTKPSQEELRKLIGKLENELNNLLRDKK